MVMVITKIIMHFVSGTLYRKYRRKVWLVISCFVFFLIFFNWVLRKNLDDETRMRVKTQRETQYIDGTGIRLVIGHYLGEGSDGHSSNFTEEQLNANMFDPKPNEGRNGQPVVIPSFLAVRARQLFHINRFNLLASDRIPLNRSLPDVRRKKCLNNALNATSSQENTVSVVIVFHNEAWSTLLRTVTSVINRSPKRLLREIILVDDASTRDFLKLPLDEYVSKLSVPTYVLHSVERKGLIRSRLLGAQKAKEGILVFLDAHCECTTGWLDSLVYHVSSNRTRVACPIIDIINDETFAYVRSFEKHLGAFNWDLHFRWYATQPNDDNDPIQPFETPVMAGGLFAINRDYFFQVGAYDDKMEIWGGENLELSFRIWQCGGSIHIIPCSHVGHIFRKSSPYLFPGGISKILYSNLVRVALVWMDDWGEFYLKFHPEAHKLKNEQDVLQRRELRKKLQCKDFEWFLRNVWNQQFMPMSERFFGKIRHITTGMCLEKPIGKSFHNQPTGVASVAECTPSNDLFQMFVIADFSTKNDSNNFVTVATDESVCLHASKAINGHRKLEVVFAACIDSEKQRWVYNSFEQRIRHRLTNLCLHIIPSERILTLNNCTNDIFQKWMLESIPWK